MTTYRLSQNLFTFSNTGNRKPSNTKRGKTTGWSKKAVINNRNFLGSIPIDSLQDGNPAYSFTLTLKDCPPSAKDFHQLRKNLIDVLNRAGAIRYHWVVEWQARGVPHLHGCFWIKNNKFDGLDLTVHWCRIASKYGPKPWAQHTSPIKDPLGWMKYLAKHSARGRDHYQRHSDNVPAEWTESTGRVWGYGGDWIQVEPIDIEDLKPQTLFRIRRAQKRLSIAQARQSQNWKWLVASRNVLKFPDEKVSKVYGLTTWCPLDQTIRLIDFYRNQDGEMPVEVQDDLFPSPEDFSTSNRQNLGNRE